MNNPYGCSLTVFLLSVLYYLRTHFFKSTLLRVCRFSCLRVCGFAGCREKPLTGLQFCAHTLLQVYSFAGKMVCGQVVLQVCRFAGLRAFYFCRLKYSLRAISTTS